MIGRSAPAPARGHPPAPTPRVVRPRAPARQLPPAPRFRRRRSREEPHDHPAVPSTVAVAGRAGGRLTESDDGLLHVRYDR